MPDPHLATSWEALDLAARRCLELAHQTLIAGGLAVGSVIVDEGGEIIAEGRNRAYDPATETDPLEETPLAHAEMNAMARLPTDSDTGRLQLWSTHRPCSMCQAAIDFVGIGTAKAIAPDPSQPEDAAEQTVDPMWMVTANVMFLLGPILTLGTQHPMVTANQKTQAAVVEIALRLADVGGGTLTDPDRSLVEGLVPVWGEIVDAAGDV